MVHDYIQKQRPWFIGLKPFVHPSTDQTATISESEGSGVYPIKKQENALKRSPEHPAPLSSGYAALLWRQYRELAVKSKNSIYSNAGCSLHAVKTHKTTHSGSQVSAKCCSVHFPVGL